MTPAVADHDDPAGSVTLVGSLFNATPDTQTQTLPALAGESYALHPVQAAGSDAP